MTNIFDTLVQKGEELKQYDISQQMNLEWDIVEERKANVLREKKKVDKLILIIETLLQCISLLLGKAQEILERGSATEEDDKILVLLQEEINRFVTESKQNVIENAQEGENVQDAQVEQPKPENVEGQQQEAEHIEEEQPAQEGDEVIEVANDAIVVADDNQDGMIFEENHNAENAEVFNNIQIECEEFPQYVQQSDD